MHVIIPYEPELHSLAIASQFYVFRPFTSSHRRDEEHSLRENFFFHSIMALRIAKAITVHVVTALSAVHESSLH